MDIGSVATQVINMRQDEEDEPDPIHTPQSCSEGSCSLIRLGEESDHDKSNATDMQVDLEDPALEESISP